MKINKSNSVKIKEEEVPVEIPKSDKSDKYTKKSCGAAGAQFFFVIFVNRRFWAYKKEKLW